MVVVVVRVVDAELAQIQGFILDLVGPLWIIKATEDDPDIPGITMEETRSTAVDAIRLLGNASAQISQVCRRKS